jgi:hypothetical protein
MLFREDLPEERCKLGVDPRFGRETNMESRLNYGQTNLNDEC